MTSRTVLALTAAAMLAAGFITSASAQKADPAAWADLIKKAQTEGGELNVTGPPSPPLRAQLAAAFKARYNITLNYFGETTSAIIQRVDTEFKANKLTIDGHIGGMSTCWLFNNRGQVKDMNGMLIDPAIVDPSVWKRGGPKLDEMDAKVGPNDPKCAFQFTEWVFNFLFVNTSVVKPPITKWDDLLRPELKDKIVSFDPRASGPGETPVAYLGKVMGDDYTKKLFVGQNVKLSTDSRQLAEWVARGEYPIGIGLVPFAVEIYRKQGLPIAPVVVNDGSGGAPLTGGFGCFMLFKNSPHPASAQLFANWLGTKEAQDIYETNMMETSLRKDVKTNIPDYVVPDPNVKYAVDDYLYTYYAGERAARIDALKAVLPKI